MDQSVRAVYQHGYLRLLGPVDLSEGQEVEIVILAPYDEAADNLPLFDVLFGNEDDESESAEEDGMSIPVAYPPADEMPLQVRSPQAKIENSSAGFRNRLRSSLLYQHKASLWDVP